MKRSIRQMRTEHELFCMYVDEHEERERHTVEAQKAYAVLEEIVEKYVLNPYEQEVVLTAALSLAVEYEESGFIGALDGMFGVGSFSELVKHLGGEDEQKQAI